MYILSNPEIKAQVQEELEAALKCSSAPTTETLSARLAQVPLEVFENQLPLVDRCIRETLRFTVVGAAIRRNVGRFQGET